MELIDDLGRAGIAGPDGALEGLGALLELLEVRVARKTARWHKGLLSPEPEVRNLGPERRHQTPAQTRLKVGFALSADRQALRAPRS